MYYFQVENSPSLKRTTLLEIPPPETLLIHQALVEPPQGLAARKDSSFE